MPEKPKFGDPCNNCGSCCKEWLCDLATAHFYRKIGDLLPGPCKALEAQGDGTYLCGLVAHPEKYAPGRTMTYGHDTMSKAAACMICAGIGCDAHRSSEGPVPAEVRARLVRAARENMKEGKRAKMIWGVS